MKKSANGFALFILLINLALLDSAWAQKGNKDLANKPEEPSEATIPSSDTDLIGTPSLYSAMKNIFTAYVKLIPLMSEPSKFTAKENETEILAQMGSMAITFRNEHTKKNIKSGILQSSLLEMNDHMDQTIKIFTQGHKEFALNRIQSTTQLCMSCHEQLPANKKAVFADFWGRFKRDQFPNDFSFAEFNYLVKNYPKSTEYYLKVIEDKSAGRGDHLLFNSIKKIVLTYTFAEFRPQELIEALDRISKQKKLPSVSKDSIANWKKTLEELKQDSRLAKVPGNPAELKQLLDSYRSVFTSVEDEVLEIKLLVVAGLLKKYMTLNPKDPSAPEILYLSGMAEKHIHRGLFFSFADIYLKSCIVEFPSSEFASKCFDAYEEGITMGYTGSAGTDIPEDVQQELAELKKKIKKKK